VDERVEQRRHARRRRVLPCQDRRSLRRRVRVPQKSTDNGVTWTQLGGLPYAAYYDVVGDGTTLYTNPSFATTGAYQNKPFYVSPETDGTTWTQYKGGAQPIPNGPYRMRFDKVNRIMYTANWDSGLWALKVE
jgi:hypothetical protein